MKWRIFEKKIIFVHYIKFWKIRLKFDRFDKKKSKICDWYFIEKNEAVGVILYDKNEDKVVLIRQFRIIAEYFNDDKSLIWPYEIVAGVVKKGEDLESAAVRECYEEIGYKVDKIIKILRTYPSPGIFGERLTLYYSELKIDNLKIKPYGEESENEDLYPIVLELNKAIEMIKEGQIVDGKTIIALLWLDKNKKNLFR